MKKEDFKKRGLNFVRRTKVVTLNDGATVQIQSINQSEERLWRKSWKKKDGTVDHAKFEYSDESLIALTIVDDEGNRPFELDDAYKGIFDLWDTRDIRKIVDESSKLCGLVRDTLEGDVEAAIKNSKETPGNSSSPDLPGKTD
jgi:hypothetical protein